MKKHLSSRVLSLLLVVALFVGLIVPVNAASSSSAMQNLEFEKVSDAVSSKLSESALDEESAESGEQYAPDDTVRVSVVLNDDSTIDRFGASDIASNASAMAYRRRLKNTQASMTQKIDGAVSGEFDVKWNLTLAANIISANVRYDQIETIKNIPGVKDVVIETRYEPMVVSVNASADPNMATSSAQIGSSTAWAAGYTGAGSKVAVIDTGIDYEQQSFSADGYNYSMKLNAEKKGMSLEAYKKSVGVLTKDDLTDEILSQLNVNVTADKAYLSDKIPFAYNYIDENYNVDHLHDTQGEHGSHVEGIAAANAYIPNGDGTFSSALDTVKVQGVAPDAQIVTMKVFGAGGGAYDSDYMAAIEDAIVLGCDSVNLSLGSGAPGFSRSAEYQNVMDSLTEHGVVVCMSAGNSYNWPEYSASGIGYLYENEVSLQVDGSPGSFTNSLAVASVDNDGFTGSFFTVGESNVFFTETSYSNAALTTLAGEHDYVILPVGVAGNAADFEGINVTGKVVFVQRGGISFYQKGENAVNAGAIATIVYNNAAGTINMDLSDYSKTAPCVSISQADGLAIWAASEQSEDGKYATGKLTIKSGIGSVVYDSDTYTMSDFSSWGVPGSLELKPEITAPGGNIYSVNGAHNGDGAHTSHTAYESMSGTSMASPQVAGMAAVMAQYIRENKLEEKTGKTARQLTNSLLMSTAKPITNAESDTPYSVLNQGAGLANVGDAINADSYIMMKDNLSGTAADGKVKAELGDDPEKTGSYTVEFSINNLSGTAQSYTFSTEMFTQDMFEYEGVNYLDTWTALLAANTTYEVDGQTFVPTSKFSCDVNGDGTTDAQDAQCILEHVAGNHTSDSCNLSVADLDGDGSVTSYDAYLLLKSLKVAAIEVPVNSAVNVKVSIKLTDETKAYLNATYPVGAYVEGYIYVETANTEDGEIVPVHSIPVLGFYGNWSDGSALDTSTFIEKLYGDERIPHTGVTQTNYLSLRYPGEKTETAYTVNPYLLEGDTTADIPYDRSAINSKTAMYKFGLSLARNAAAAVYYVQNEAGEVVYMGGVSNQVTGAYYYVNGSKWQQTGASLTANQKPASLGFKEGDKFTAGVALIPEYYEEDGEMTAEQVKALIESGRIGDGCLFSYEFTVDDTAPEVLSIQKDLQTGALTIVTKDNQYVAFVGVYKGSSSKLIAGGLPSQDAAGETCGAVIPLDDTAGEYITVTVADYAGNEVSYKVNYGGTPEDFSGRMFAFTSGTSRGSGTRWVEVDPENLTSSAGMTDYAEVEYDAYAAEYAGKYIFFATADGIYAAEQEDPANAQKVTSFSGFDADEMVADMAFNTQNKTMYVLTNHISNVASGTITNIGNKLYTLDLATGAMEKVADITSDGSTSMYVLRTLAIDNNGTFYAVNNASSVGGRLYSWKLDDVADGKLNVTGSKITASSYYVTSYASMAYDHDNNVLYLTGAYGSKSGNDTDNELWVIDPVALTAAHPASGNAQFSDHVTGLYVVPSNTITLPKNVAITSVELNETALTVPKGAILSLSASVYPWLAADKSVTWSTTDENVVSVDNGDVKALKVGSATVTATSVADPTKSASCTFTVTELPDVKASALVYGSDSKAYWSDISLRDPEGWTKVSEGGSYLAGTLHEGELLVHSGDTMFGVDPDEFTTTSYGTIASSWIWSDAAESPATEDGLFGRMIGLCMNGTYMEMLNPAEGSLSYWDLSSKGFADDPLATIAYAGSGTYDYQYIIWSYPDCPANFYYAMTESGVLYKFTVFTYTEGESYTMVMEEIGSSGLELTNVSAVTGGQYASMIYDQDSGYLLISAYSDGETANLYAINPSDMILVDAGTFGEKVWPVVSLYQYDRATDLTLKLSKSDATIYVGDSTSVSAKVILGSTKNVTWSSSNNAVATVEDGVITGVGEGTATITATTVDTNKAGQHVSKDVAVTVKPLMSLNATVNAQVETEQGTAWMNIDLSDMSTTKLADASTTFYGGGYAVNYLWGTDVNGASGNIYRVDPSNGFEESKGSSCSTDYAIRDLADAPAVTVKLTTEDQVYTGTAFGSPIYLSATDGVYELVDYVEGSLSGWRASSSYTDLAGIAYVGDLTIEDANKMLPASSQITEADADTICHLYYVLGVNGNLYQFITAPVYDVKADEGEEVGAYLLRGSLGNIGISFENVDALSMSFVSVSSDNYGLVIADAESGSFYYANLAGEEIVAGKVGTLNGATNISSLYNASAATATNAQVKDMLFGTKNLTAVQTAANAVYEKGMEPAGVTASTDVSLRSTEKASVSAASSKNADTMMVKAEANVAAGSLNAASPKANVSKGTNGYGVLYTLRDTEDMTNGKYVVSYDPSKLKYVDSSARSMSAIHVDEVKGEITIALASETSIPAGSNLAAITFSVEKNVTTKITTVTKERNGNVSVSEAPVVDTVDTTEQEEPIVIPSNPVISGSGSSAKKFPFTDVSKYDECYDAVKYLYENDIMNGTSDTLFSPNAELTRGMVVTILYRMEGEPFTTGAKTFSDVASNRYYSKAVEWAAENDIVNGYTDGTFKPDQAVTREQLAAIIRRYADFNGIVIYAPDNALASTDVVSNWAKNDVAWAAAEGILSSAQTANATKNATRAEVAMAIYTYLTKTAK